MAHSYRSSVEHCSILPSIFATVHDVAIAKRAVRIRSQDEVYFLITSFAFLSLQKSSWGGLSIKSDKYRESMHFIEKNFYRFQTMKKSIFIDAYVKP
jgi:hypothetical protein